MKVIGISDNYSPQKFLMYEQYVRSGLPDATVVKLSEGEEATGVNGCDALVLTGGGDVHPRFYGRTDALSLMTDVNENRDLFEMSLVVAAVERGIPILGICRGLQLFNVAMGGSLLPDIESSGYPTHRERQPDERRHRLLSVAGTRVAGIINGGSDEVNTLHHQAVDRVGNGLKVSATSPDGIVESLGIFQ